MQIRYTLHHLGRTEEKQDPFIWWLKEKLEKGKIEDRIDSLSQLMEILIENLVAEKPEIVEQVARSFATDRYYDETGHKIIKE